jgi:hypothetical protein
MVRVPRWVPVLLLALAACDAAARDDTWALQLPGVSRHFGAPQQPGEAWNELHDGLGLQRTQRHASHVVRLTGGFMRDSFNHQGLYAGGALGYRLLEGEYEVDLAAAPMLLYRSTRFDDARGPAPRKLIPIVLPMLTVEHRASGIGANLTILPAGNFGKELRFPGLIYLQFTVRFRQ